MLVKRFLGKTNYTCNLINLIKFVYMFVFFYQTILLFIENEFIGVAD